VKASLSSIFRSLEGYNYRLWLGGAFVSYIGTWMQRTAQDWLVLAELTAHDATALGVVTALQYVPQLLWLPWSGVAADRFNQRKLLLATQSAMCLLSLALGILTVTGTVQLWQVYLFAFLFGSAAAFDAPVSQSFTAELVGDARLANAVALNSSAFNAARMIGPAVSGIVIAATGSGWAFIINGASFGAVLLALALLRVAELRPAPRATRSRGQFLEGVRYAWHRLDLRVMLIMLFLIGTFGLNFSIFISTMAVSVFHADARAYGLLSSIMAIGTLAGALLNARREKAHFNLLITGTAAFGASCALAAVAPNYGCFAVMLIAIGISALTFTNSTNSLMQLSVEPSMRGRMMGLRIGIGMGGIPIGAPIIGWVANQFGPRWAMAVGAAAGISAATTALFAMKGRANEAHKRSPQ